jgi:hypothetical protein
LDAADGWENANLRELKYLQRQRTQKLLSARRRKIEVKRKRLRDRPVANERTVHVI